MSTIIEKLYQKTSKDNDTAIINEAYLALELFEPYLEEMEPNEFQCENLDNDILPHENHCGMCEGHNKTDDHYSCPRCNNAVDPAWKICPECGEKIDHSEKTDHNYCLRCGEKVESTWKLCPFCGAPTN